MRISDWSSDVCSSDLLYAAPAPARTDNRTTIDPAPAVAAAPFNALGTAASKTITVSGAALTPGRWYLTAVSRGASSNIVLRAAITQADPRPEQIGRGACRGRECRYV